MQTHEQGRLCASAPLCLNAASVRAIHLSSASPARPSWGAPSRPCALSVVCRDWGLPV